MRTTELDKRSGHLDSNHIIMFSYKDNLNIKYDMLLLPSCAKKAFNIIRAVFKLVKLPLIILEAPSHSEGM